MEGLTSTIVNFITGVQVIGGGVAALMGGVAAYHFFKGGREDFQIGKGKLAGIVIGLVVLLGCIPLKDWISSMIGF